ncbi:TIGR00282 family metallophosphoesterase [Patescibacteria group bacterium]|nr:TIGR00282 family metallophosphoesterase [Patescibacteria group bacterium]
MKILFFGDIVGQPGRQALVKILPDLKKELAPDLVLANGENIAHGQGLTEKSVKEILDGGVEWLTTGDHVFALKEGAQMLDEKKRPVLRPLNWPGSVPGRGYEIITKGARRILLVNLIGRVFMKQDFDDPFQKMSELLEDYSIKGNQQGSETVDVLIVDFHAEATSEKAALAWYLDGQVSAILGTHTHVPTADEKILPQGTAFISDVGMVGAQNSILGVQKETVIKRFLTQRLLRMEVAEGLVEVNGVLITLDEKTGLAQNIERIRKMVALD